MIPGSKKLMGRPLRRDEGFVLIEVMMAILVLAIGVFGTINLTLAATNATSANKAREGATNLGREAVESVLALPYSSVDPSNVRPMLQAEPGLAPAAGYSGWTVVRRQIAYTLSVDGCYLDDPADGLGPHVGTFCTGSAAGTADSRPIDHKRFSITVTWSQNGIQRSIRQSTVLGAKGEVDVPAVRTITSAGGVTITNPSVTSIDFSATTSASATGVDWSLDDSVSGLATGSGTSWSFTWNLSGVPDGQYLVGARAYNSAGTYGTPLSLLVTLNRTASTPPESFVAGWNRQAGTVDSEWLASAEADTVGYTVYRRQTYPTTGSITKVNCGTLAAPLYVTTQTQCADASPIVPSGTGGVDFRAATSGKADAQTSITIARPAGVLTGRRSRGHSRRERQQGRHRPCRLDADRQHDAQEHASACLVLSRGGGERAGQLHLQRRGRQQQEAYRRHRRLLGGEHELADRCLGRDDWNQKCSGQPEPHDHGLQHTT